ncbi:MAG: type 4a pilus biogenesis protein PilO [Phycisphaerales bacterium]
MNFGIRELIFVAVLLAMPISSYWFVFKPRNEQIAQARKEIEHKELLLQKLQAATDQSADLARENEAILKEIEHVQSRLPSDKEVDVILRQVSELATQNNLKLDRVRAVRAISSASYMEQPLEMNISGNFDNFYNFLLELEQLKRITRLPKLKLKAAREQNGQMEAEFTLSIYFEPATGSVASARSNP